MTHLYVSKLVHPWLRFRLMALRRQVYHQLNSSEHILWNFNQNTTLILQEDEFEKVVSASVNIHPWTSYLTSWSSFRVFTLRFPGSDKHYNDVIIGAMASQITSLTIVYSTVYSGADQRRHQSSALLAFWGGGGGFTGDRWISRAKGQ